MSLLLCQKCYTILQLSVQPAHSETQSIPYLSTEWQWKNKKKHRNNIKRSFHSAYLVYHTIKMEIIFNNSMIPHDAKQYKYNYHFIHLSFVEYIPYSNTCYLKKKKNIQTIFMKQSWHFFTTDDILPVMIANIFEKYVPVVDILTKYKRMQFFIIHVNNIKQNRKAYPWFSSMYYSPTITDSFINWLVQHKYSQCWYQALQHNVVKEITLQL